MGIIQLKEYRDKKSLDNFTPCSFCGKSILDVKVIYEGETGDVGICINCVKDINNDNW